MILETLLTIIVIILIVIALNIRDEIRYDKMSFKEAIDLTGLPIVTFYQNDKKFNFLLDTGANNSVINKSALELLEHNLVNKSTTVTGINGKPISAECVSLYLTYGNKNYEETFQAIDMSEAFKVIKEESGVSLVGILGSEFFKRNKYILDFNKLIAYSKK